MSSVVVVHGIGQQLEGAHTLHARMFPALLDGLERAGRSICSEDVSFASYGELFRPHSEMLAPTSYFDATDVEIGYEQEFLKVLWKRASDTDQAVIPPEEETLARTPVMAKRALAALSRSRYFARISERIMVGDLKQVRRYFHDPEERSSIQQKISRCIASDTRVIIGHSLGSVVAYEAICAHPEWSVRSFVTLGSPLGIRNLIYDRLQPPPRRRPGSVNLLGVWPGSIKRWTNIADSGDVVAAVEDIRQLFEGAIRQIRVHNGSHAHDMSPYLSDKLTGRAIAEGLDA